MHLSKNWSCYLLIPNFLNELLIEETWRIYLVLYNYLPATNLNVVTSNANLFHTRFRSPLALLPFVPPLGVCVFDMYNIKSNGHHEFAWYVNAARSLLIEHVHRRRLGCLTLFSMVGNIIINSVDVHTVATATMRSWPWVRDDDPRCHGLRFMIKVGS